MLDKSLSAGKKLRPVANEKASTGNGMVNSTEISLTKLKSGQAVDASNFRADVTVTNSIDASDVGTMKSKAGTALP
jgi:hypothetical protein